VDDFAFDVGEAHVAAVVEVGEFGVVEPEQVEDGGMEIVHLLGLVDGFEAVFIGGADDGAAFDAAAGEPDGEALRVVVWAGGRIRRARG
jgi:hypothetical protein